MNWKLKAWVFRALCAVPGGAALHHWVQRHVTRELPRSAQTHAVVGEQAGRFADLMRSHLGRPLEQCAALEFGAGRDLALALGLRGRGVGTVLATDLFPLAKPDLVRAAAERLLPHRPAPVSFDELRGSGVDYRAPFDIRSSGLPEGGLDCVVSSDVMEHIPAADIPAVLAESRRILKPGGLAIMHIDYSDHYARSDRNISRFNFLKYEDRDWSRYDSRFQSVNRLRHRDYLAAFERAGFSILKAETNDVPPVEEIVRELAPRFQGYTLTELFVQDALIVARKPPGAAP